MIETIHSNGSRAHCSRQLNVEWLDNFIQHWSNRHTETHKVRNLWKNFLCTIFFSFSKFLVTVKRNAYKCCFENGRLLKRWSKIAHQNLNHTQALFNVVRMTKSYIFFCLLKICNRNYFISSFVRSNSIRHQNC